MRPYWSEVSQYEKIHICRQFDGYIANNMYLWPLKDHKMATHAILRKTYGHYSNSISCPIGQRCHSIKMYTFEGNLMAAELSRLYL